MDIKSELKNGKNIYELPLKVCYYARVSTDNAEQVTSIVNQVDYFTRYINGIDNWTLVDGYIDEGISGKEVKRRENFMRMIRDAKNGRFDLVLTKSVSRFARNTMDSIFYTNLLLDMGVGVFFLNDNINTFYGDSEFRLTLMASIAQDELRKLSESVRFGLRQSINRGVVLGNNNILGYVKDNGKLVINDAEALIVKEIFDLYAGGIHNYSEIARRINSKYIRRLNGTSIRRVLTNYKYKGYYCGKKSEIVDYKKNKRKNFNKEEWFVYKDYDKVPPIIDDNLWDRVNEIILGNSLKNIELDVYKNKVFCKEHGKVITKRKLYKNKYYYYYICNGCFRVSSKLIDKIVKNRVVDKIVINDDEVLKLNVFYNKEKNIISN